MIGLSDFKRCKSRGSVPLGCHRRPLGTEAWGFGDVQLRNEGNRVQVLLEQRAGGGMCGDSY